MLYIYWIASHHQKILLRKKQKSCSKLFHIPFHQSLQQNTNILYKLHIITSRMPKNIYEKYTKIVCRRPSPLNYRLHQKKLYKFCIRPSASISQPALHTFFYVCLPCMIWSAYFIASLNIIIPSNFFFKVPLFYQFIYLFTHINQSSKDDMPTINTYILQWFGRDALVYCVAVCSCANYFLTLYNF